MKKTIQIEDSKINEKLNKKDNERPIPIYYYFGIALIAILAYISYQIEFFFGIILFPSLGIILYSKIKKDDDTKVTTLEVVKTMPIAFIILLLIGAIMFIIYFPFLFQ